MSTVDYIYLDHAAATPLDPKVEAAMQPYFCDAFFNPSSPYAPAVAVRRDYESAKDALARTIGAKGNDIIMTAGATESINLAFSSVRGHRIVTAIEHHAVLAAARATGEVTVVEVGRKGVVLPEAIQRAIRPETTLVSVGLANNELGTIQPLRAISEIILAERARRREVGDTTPIYLHSDASQGVGQVDCNVARLGIDLLTLNAGKVYGPKQVGLLWAATGVQLLPQVVGGGQERGVRSGTENVAGVIGFSVAMQLAEKHRKSETIRLRELRDRLQARLQGAFPDMLVSGDTKRRLSGHLHVSFPGLDGERLVFLLEMSGVLVATGSACAANKGTRSHVLTAIGMSDAEADGSIRISLGHLSTPENTEQAAAHIIAAVQKEMERTKKTELARA